MPTSIAVDGNQDGATNDWEGLSLEAGFSPIQDPVGNADLTTFNSCESDYPNWQVGLARHGVRSKSDIGNVYVYSYRERQRRPHRRLRLGPRR